MSKGLCGISTSTRQRFHNPNKKPPNVKIVTLRGRLDLTIKLDYKPRKEAGKTFGA